MSTFGLLAHELDAAKASGIASYATGLAEALVELTPPADRITVITAPGCGHTTAPLHLLPGNRRYLYGAWRYGHLPPLELLVRGLDLVHVTAPIVPVPTRKPLVITIHDLMPVTNPEFYPASEVANYLRCLRWAERKAAVVLVPTETIAADIRRLTSLREDRLLVTGEGVDLQHFAGSGGDEVLARHQLEPRGYSLHVGQLVKRKNLVTLIEALRPHDPPLVLVGTDGLGADDIHRAAAAKPGQVRLLGRLSDDEVGVLVRQARALVHPSYYEGFGLTVLEAMAAGTPVIVSPGGALPEVVGDGGFIADGFEVADWSAALDVLHDEALLEQLRKAGPVRAADWSWAQTAQRTLAGYAQAMAA